METKKCSECGRILPLSEFNKKRNSKDGLQDRCRECFSRYNRARYAANREKTKEAVRRYRAENPQCELETRIKACEKNPNHKNAYMALDAAIRAGIVEKPDVCSGCGKHATGRGLEAHHHDYSKPLDVIWLCKKCHRSLDELRRAEEGLPRDVNQRAVAMLDGDRRVLAVFASRTDAARFVGGAPNRISEAASSGKVYAGHIWIDRSN